MTDAETLLSEICAIFSQTVLPQFKRGKRILIEDVVELIVDQLAG